MFKHMIQMGDNKRLKKVTRGHHLVLKISELEPRSCNNTTNQNRMILTEVGIGSKHK